MDASDLPPGEGDDPDQPRGPSPYSVLFTHLATCVGLFLWGREFHLLQGAAQPGPAEAGGASGGVAQGMATILLCVAIAAAPFAYLVWRDGWPSAEPISDRPRGSAPGWAIMLFLVLPMMAGPPGLWGAGVVANCILDSSPRVQRVARVLGSRPSMAKGDYGIRGWLKLDDRGKERWVPVKWAKYLELKDASSVALATRAGALNMEWLASIDLAP